jgi:hypothetical protein
LEDDVAAKGQLPSLGFGGGAVEMVRSPMILSKSCQQMAASFPTVFAEPDSAIPLASSKRNGGLGSVNLQADPVGGKAGAAFPIARVA